MQLLQIIAFERLLEIFLPNQMFFTGKFYFRHFGTKPGE